MCHACAGTYLAPSPIHLLAIALAGTTPLFSVPPLHAAELLRVQCLRTCAPFFAVSVCVQVGQPWLRSSSPGTSGAAGASLMPEPCSGDHGSVSHCLLGCKCTCSTHAQCVHTRVRSQQVSAGGHVMKHCWGAQGFSMLAGLHCARQWLSSTVQGTTAEYVQRHVACGPGCVTQGHAH